MSLDQEHRNLIRKLLDPVVFLKHFVSIETEKGYQSWRDVMDSYQKHLLRDLSRNRIINKSKKTGISTTIAGEAVHKAFIYPGRQVVLVSTGQRIAQELLGKFYDEFDSIPVALKPELVGRSKDQAEFPNKSRVYSIPSHNPSNIRGLGMRGSATEVYLDEYAHVSNDRELWIVTRDFPRYGGKLTLISTPKGRRGKFAEIAEPLQVVYRGLVEPKPSEWSYHEITYKECPRLVNQEEELKSEMTEMDFNSEYQANFEDESVAFFPYEILEKAQKVEEFVSDGYTTKNNIQFGIDFGQSVSETVIYIVEEVEPEKFKTIYVEILPGVSYPDQVETIKYLDKVFRPSIINIDGTGPGGQVLRDYLQKEEELGNLVGKVCSYDLMSTFKEKIIIRARVLMERGRFLIPDPKSNCPYAEKVERQFHSVQRTATQSGEHTRYSGKATGMDDIVWAGSLSLYKEFTIEFSPFFAQTSDPVLDKLKKVQERTEKWQVVREWEV